MVETGESGEGGGSDRQVTTSDIVQYVSEEYAGAGVEIERLVVLLLSPGVYAVKLLEKGQAEEEAFFVNLAGDDS